MFSVQAPQVHSIQTADGVRLDADVYYPVGEGPFPVLLMRQPYGRAIASTIVYAHPRWYAAHGYIVIIQDVRGRGTSTGEFDLFAHEVADGQDTLTWAAQLPGSDGQIGMYGFSYQGMTQLQAAQEKHPALKTIVPAMTGYHLYEDWAYENGALCLQLGLTWAIQLAAETARLKKDTATYRQLLASARTLPLHEPCPAQPNVLSEVASFFHEWVSRSPTDPYWQERTPNLDGVDMPTLQIGGWFDPYLRGDIRLYKELKANSQHTHHLWIGPWGHIPWSRKVGELDFGPAAISPVDQLQIQWFDSVLKSQKAKGDRSEHAQTSSQSRLKAESSNQLSAQQKASTPALSNEHPVCLFEMGRNQWRTLPDWPDSDCPTDRAERCTFKSYFLQSDGLVNVREDSGKLSNNSSLQKRQDTLVHDPWNPAPARGGHSAIPAGPFERSAIDARGDVLIYTSQPLKKELRVAGIANVIGKVAASTPSYDLCAVLSRVKNGRVYNLTQGYKTIHADKSNCPTTITLPLHPTCFSIAPGECIRLSLSLACFPAYPVNPGTGKAPATASLIEAQIITAHITVGGCTGTFVQLPVVDSAVSAIA